MENELNPVQLAEGVLASDYALKNLGDALRMAQPEFASVIKTEENKWGGYRYTSLENIVAASRPALAKYGIVATPFHSVDTERKTVTLGFRVAHPKSGEWFINTFELPAELALGKDGGPKFNQQTIQGSFTYALKTLYKGIFGTPDSEEMIDGAEQPGANLPARPKAKAPAPAKSSAREQAAFFRRAKEKGVDLHIVAKRMQERFDTKQSSDLTVEQLDSLLKADVPEGSTVVPADVAAMFDNEMDMTP